MCPNPRTSTDIDMKLEPVTKLNKINTATSKKIDDDMMSANCYIIAIFRIYGQFGAIRKLDSRHMVVKLTVSSIITFDLRKFEDRTKKLRTITLSTIIFLKLRMCVYLCTNFKFLA